MYGILLVIGFFTAAYGVDVTLDIRGEYAFILNKEGKPLSDEEIIELHADMKTEYDGLECKLSEISGLALQCVSMECKALPDSISNLKNLACLEILDGEITNFTVLEELNNLEILKIHNIGLECIPDQVFHLKKLRILSLDSNELKSLSKALKKLENLEELSLVANNFFEIPAILCSLSNIKRVCLAANSLTSEALGSEIGQMLLRKGVEIITGSSNSPRIDHRMIDSIGDSKRRDNSVSPKNKKLNSSKSLSNIPGANISPSKEKKSGKSTQDFGGTLRIKKIKKQHFREGSNGH